MNIEQWISLRLNRLSNFLRHCDEENVTKSISTRECCCKIMVNDKKLSWNYQVSMWNLQKVEQGNKEEEENLKMNEESNQYLHERALDTILCENHFFIRLNRIIHWVYIQWSSLSLLWYTSYIQSYILTTSD